MRPNCRASPMYGNFLHQKQTGHKKHNHFAGCHDSAPGLARRMRTDPSNGNHRRAQTSLPSSSVALQNGGSSLVNRRPPTNCERPSVADSVRSPTGAYWYSSSQNLNLADWPVWRRLSDRSGSVIVPGDRRKLALASLERRLSWARLPFSVGRVCPGIEASRRGRSHR